jgi:1A family penicillin-binding protein
MAWMRLWKKRVRNLKRQTGIGGVGRLNRVTLIRYAAIGGFLGVLLLFILAAFAFAWYAKDLPRPDKIVRKEGFATKIFDRDGDLLYSVFADQKRTPATLDQVPKYLQQATVATEDKNFYQHGGFDTTGYARAIYNTIFRGQLSGGSTLTQQLVKNVLLSPKRTIGRKIKEFVLAVQIERKYTKDEILQMYLNEAPYGGTAWGVASAAESYFNKPVSELSLLESAILAGLPQRPSYYSPFGDNPEAYKSRTMDVLRRMREDGYITKEQEEQVLKELTGYKFEGTGGEFLAPHFVMYVKSLLEERYGDRMVEQGGLNVYTTLDLDLQKETEKVVKEEIDKVEALHITNGAALAMDPQTGEILAMVGSKDYFDPDYDGKVNVTLSLRQPGSAIKPVTYATAFGKGFTPASMIVDAKTEFPGATAAKPYAPQNYTGKFSGPVPLRNALGSSLNLPAVKLLALVGIEDMLETGYRMGLSTFEPTRENVNRLGLSVTLGGGEVRLIDLISAYSAFANEGYKVEPVAVLKVEDASGRVLEETKPEKGKQVLTSEQAFLVSHVLSDNQARLLTFGANSLLNIGGWSVAVKTGTTDDKRDNWTVGWTPGVIVGVWVGNNDNTEMKEVASGVSGASPIWRRAILGAFAGKPVQEFKVPDGIERVKLDAVSGWPEHDGFAAREEFVIKGTQPTGEDPVHTKLKVCRDQEDKLAPEAMVAKGEYNEKEFVVLKEEDPFGGEVNRWQKGIDEWIGSQDDSRYKVPKEYCEANEEVVVRFERPNDKTQVGNKFEVEIRVGTSGEVDKIELMVNDDKRATFTSKPYRTDLNLGDGTYKLKAKAWLKNGKTGENEIRIGVNKPWDGEQPAASPTPGPSPSPSPSPSSSP